MRGYFDEKEPELEEPVFEEPERPGELILGWRALLGIVICLVLVCGACFGIGYTLGRRRSAPAVAAATPHASEIPAPDQEPLQTSGAVPKPSADAQAPVPPSAPPDNGAQPSAPDGSVGANQAPAQPDPAPAQPGPVPAKHSSPAARAPAAPAKTRARPALPSPAKTPNVAESAAPPNEHADQPAQSEPMVQIAAVSNQEDANVLMGALRNRGYTVTSRREPADGLIHVRIGPFSSREEANRWCNKLLSDGYNAEVQQ
jgi:cell division septation protein DedD